MFADVVCLLELVQGSKVQKQCLYYRKEVVCSVEHWYTDSLKLMCKSLKVMLKSRVRKRSRCAFGDIHLYLASGSLRAALKSRSNVSYSILVVWHVERWYTPYSL